MKLGFALKKTKKPGLQGAAAGGSGAHGGASGVAGVFTSALPAKQEVEKVFVTDFDPNARTAVEFDKDGNVKKALVIPLIKANEWKSEDGATDGGGGGRVDGNATQQAAPVKGDEPMLTADELAAKELLADAKSQANGGAKSGSSSSSHAANLVIPMNGKLAQSSSSTESGDGTSHKEEEEEDEKTRAIKAKLFNFESQEKNRKKNSKSDESAVPTAPILRQNVVPGMDALEDVNEKYRLDVSMRPDELDVHSVAYDMVPIEDFGAALLRGMGWKGSVENDDKSAEPKPRHKLLGLGATIRPPIPGEAKNKHKKKFSNSQQQSAKPSSRKDESSDKPRHSGLNHTEANSSKESKQRDRRSSHSPSPRRSREDGGRSSKRDSRNRRRSSSRDRRSSRDDDKDNGDRSRSKGQSSRGDDDRHGSRRRSRSRERGARDHSSDRGRDRKQEEKSTRGERDDRHCDDRRKRSRSRDRSSDRKRSSRR